MGLTFHGHLLLSKLKPVLSLLNACYSVRAPQCHKALFVPSWKYPVKSNTWICASSAGFHSQCARHADSSLLRHGVLSSCPRVVPSTSVWQYSSDAGRKQEDKTGPGDAPVAPERLSLFKRFKQMYRDYWYVLIPVHVVTSIGWFGAFYYMCVSGVDVVAALESLNVSEKIINPLRDSKAGYLALSYAMYKIATPLRYTVTLGGTTVSINYLKKWGYIKPIPPREKLKEMYDEKKENLMERKDAIIKETTEQLREHKDSFMKSYRHKE